MRDHSSVSRRTFLAESAAAAAAAAIGLSAPGAAAEGAAGALHAGQGTADVTPPVGIEMAGFHRAPGKERRVGGIRQEAAVRALVLRLGDAQAALVSLDLCAVSPEFCRTASAAVEKATGIPAANVRFCATHTHSMPTLRWFRQWGAVSPEYQAKVQEAVAGAVRAAAQDLAPTEFLAGRARVTGGNFNRTTKDWKTDVDFAKDSTDDRRWLDTMLHALVFRRAGKPELVWYHFSAHPVCYTDDKAGPDWPGLVEARCKADGRPAPSLLQGHAGDVNPGDGNPWLGVPEKVADAVYAGLKAAVEAAKPVKPDRLVVRTAAASLPLDLALFKQWIEQYRADPDKCKSGPWVDAGFAADWAQGAARWDMGRTELSVPLSAIGLGAVGLVFHPAELYSFYGLAIRRESPWEHTLVVGYTDDIIGYLPDPNAFKAGEYAATVVPKIIDLPPFKPDAAGVLAAEAVKLLRAVKG